MGFLGARNVLPNTIPTDVVELKTNHLITKEASKVQLEHNLQEWQYLNSPQAVKSLQRKKFWRSRGVRLLPNRIWEEIYYAVCKQCKRFHWGIHRNGCARNLRRPGGEPLSGHTEMKGRFIVPEQGFVAASETETPGETAPQRTYASQVYFTEYRSSKEDQAEEKQLIFDAELSSSKLSIYTGYSNHGWLAMVNNGFGTRF